ncbi:hypothetical protein L596_029075 [Steinernema carpocapsae]|uniref:Uncharacterized protein n=1 Tax=Steinernema carpocapsae TaxID=34508 RepID=A0A4U5LTK0_STECR|nr:hypothetical protein L596_029075 [Steinernema carpocapsae]
MAGCCKGCCEIILCLLFPPLAVWFHAGQCDSHVSLSLCLLLFFVIPSILHALWFCFCRVEAPRHITVHRY